MKKVEGRLAAFRKALDSGDDGALARAALATDPDGVVIGTLGAGHMTPDLLALWAEAAERIRAAGAGIGAFFTPTGYGTELAKGKEVREIGGRMQVLEYPLHADYALIKAERGDRWGNLCYRMTARNFGPVMAAAAKFTVATVHEIVELGQLDPEAVATPGIYVNKVVQVPRVATKAGGFKKAA